MSESDAVDGSCTGTEVPCMWVLLRAPRFGGAKHASGHDNRSRALKAQILNFDRQIMAWHRSSEASKRLDEIPAHLRGGKRDHRVVRNGQRR